MSTTKEKGELGSAESRIEVLAAAPEPRVGVASRLHLVTVVLVLTVLGTATLVSHLTGHSGQMEFQADQRLRTYVGLVGLELLLLVYVAFGIYRHGGTVSSVVHEAPPKWFSSIAFGLGGIVVWMVLGAVIMFALQPTVSDMRAVQSFLPRTMAEKFGFAVMTLTAGFCEEFIYRGYLQRQFQAWTGSLTLAIILQAGLFALMHVTLPWKFLVSAIAMAIFLGALVGWRKTLVPAMLTHAGVNLLGGLLSNG